MTGTLVDFALAFERQKISPNPAIARSPALRDETSTVLIRRVSGTEKLRYYLYLPRNITEQTPVLVAVHGISRNATAQVRAFAPLAEQFGVALIAPLFEHRHFPHYQRFRRNGCGERADHALSEILRDAARHTGLRTARICLFGYSGGAQFVHRYAFAYPERVIAMVLGAAGWYTLPRKKERFPYGLKSNPIMPDLDFDLEKILRIPTCVLVGARDTKRDRALKCSARIDGRQGKTRLCRARRWVRSMSRAAKREGLATPYLLDTLPRTGHSFAESAASGKIAERTFCFLFGAASLRAK